MSTDHLVQVDPALGSDQAAGALLVRDGGGMWLLWLRTEVEQTVDWGGDPRQLKAGSGRRRTHPGSARAPPSTDGGRSSGAGRSLGAPGRSTPPSGSGPPSSATLARRSQEQMAIVSDLHDVLGTSAMPTVPGLELYADYRPADGGYLGGDWWDVLPLPDGSSIALMLGDIAGHGSRGRRHDDPGPHQPARLRHGRRRAGGGPGTPRRPGLPPPPRRPGHRGGRVAGPRHRPPADRAGRRARAAAGRPRGRPLPAGPRTTAARGQPRAERPAARSHPGDGHEPACCSATASSSAATPRSATASPTSWRRPAPT